MGRLHRITVSPCYHLNYDGLSSREVKMLGMAESEPLTAVDAAWLNMERRTNPMTITGVLFFSDPLSYSGFREVLEDKLLIHDRFRQLVKPAALPLFRPRWVEDDAFNMRSHLRRVALPEPAGEQELVELVADLMSVPLPRSKPLWDMHLVEKYGKGSAVVVRIHHAVADGIALVRLLFSLADQEPELPSVGVPITEKKGLVEQIIDAVGRGAAGADVATRLLALPPDPATPLKKPLSSSKRVGWAGGIKVAEIKQACAKPKCKINDFMLAAVAGGLRRYLSRLTTVPKELVLRAVVPVNLRPISEPLTMGNKFGLVFVELPVGLKSVSARLEAIKANMERIKASPEAVGVFAVLGTMGAAGAALEKIAVDIFSSKATMVLTNVPGPPKHLTIAGSTLEKVIFWVPQSGDLALGVSIISYGGEVTVGIATDSSVCTNPSEIAELIMEEASEMLGGWE